MALPIVLGAAALRAGLSLSKSQGPRAVVKKYGDDGLKQIEKIRKKELTKIDAKAGRTGKELFNPQKSGELSKIKARDKRIDSERLEDALDIINEIKDEVPLKFSKGGLLSTDSSRIGYADGKLVNPEKADLDNDGKLSSYEEARGEAIEENMREQKQVGGMMMDDQMADMMEEEENEMPMDNQMADIMPEEKTEEQKAIEEAQAPDEKMEDNYVDFLIDEALSDEEEGMLMQELQANPQLSMLFDKVMEVAMEFSGSGPVEGPGSEVSDSIPARLSDGEFVFTAKAVDVLGADNLMLLMKQAEAQAEQRQPAQEGGLMEEENVMPVEQQPVEQNIRVTKETVGSQAAMQEEEDLVGDELKKSMLSTRPYVRS